MGDLGVGHGEPLIVTCATNPRILPGGVSIAERTLPLCLASWLSGFRVYLYRAGLRFRRPQERCPRHYSSCKLARESSTLFRLPRGVWCPRATVLTRIWGSETLPAEPTACPSISVQHFDCSGRRSDD